MPLLFSVGIVSFSSAIFYVARKNPMTDNKLINEQPAAGELLGAFVRFSIVTIIGSALWMGLIAVCVMVVL